MRYLVYLLAVIGTLGITSCSKKNDPGEADLPQDPQHDDPQLVLQASTEEIEIGEEISFTVSAEGTAVEADLYINNQKISGLTHTFDTKGKYTVVAKKTGYKDSEAQEVKAYQVDVYVGGIVWHGTSFVDPQYITYWKNGDEVRLDDGRVGTIAVDNGDVYISGYVIEGSRGSVAKYWKNGNPVELEEHAYAHAIFVHDGDVYVAGGSSSGSMGPKYWKNGTPVELELPSGVSVSDGAYSIVVEDGDIHVVGLGYNGSTPMIAYWKNGLFSQITLPSGTNTGDYRARLAVDNGDVYIAGLASAGLPSNAVATYWKNRLPIELSSPMISFAQSVFAIDGDVYVLGTEYESTSSPARATYWKNGTAVSVTDGSQYVQPEAIFVENGDVYTVTQEYNGVKYNVVYRKNGKDPVVLTENHRNLLNTYSIYVARSY